MVARHLLLALLLLSCAPADAGVVGTWGCFPRRPNYQLVVTDNGADTTWAMNAEVVMMTCCSDIATDSTTFASLPCANQKVTVDLNVQVRGRWSSQDQANLRYQEAFFDSLYGGFYPLRVQGIVRWRYDPALDVRLADSPEDTTRFQVEAVYGGWVYSAGSPCYGGRERQFRLWKP